MNWKKSHLSNDSATSLQVQPGIIPVLVHLGQLISNPVMLGQYHLVHISNTRVGPVTELALSDVHPSPSVSPHLVQPIIIVAIDVGSIQVSGTSVHQFTSLEVTAVGAEGRHGAPVAQAAAALVQARHTLGVMA